MDQLSVGNFNFLLFVVPGFIIVWTFRYFTHSKKTGDFELLGLSFVWGLISLLIYEALVDINCWLQISWACKSGNADQEIQAVLKNPYAAALAFVLVGLVFGWFGSVIVSWKWFQKMIQIFTPKKFREIETKR
jgi:hypothetical protein